MPRPPFNRPPRTSNRPLSRDSTPLIRISRLHFTTVLALLVLAVAACSQGSACTGLSNPQGWSSATIVGDALYVGTMEGELVALDREGGDILWRFALQTDDDDVRAIYGSPTVTEDSVVFGGYDGVLYALSLETGEEVLFGRVRVGDGEPIVGGAVVADDLVLVGSSDGYLYAFGLAEGEELWRFKTGGEVWSTPAVDNGIAYIGSMDRKLYAVDTSDGSKRWEFSTNGAITAKPLVSNGRVYVGSFDGTFYAVDGGTGDEVWRFDGANKWYWSGAVVEEDTLFAASLDGHLYALDVESGELVWKLNAEAPIVGSPAIVGDRVAVASDDGTVRLVRRRDGSDERRCSTGEKIRAGLSQMDRVLYVMATDHSIRALSVKSNGNPDEEWVHFTNKDEPFQLDRIPDC